ncbi:MAG: Maf family protein [Chthoniobacterales bacterium]
MSEAGFKFEVVAPDVAELSGPALTACELTQCNAMRKGRALRSARDVVLAADTVVAIDDRVLGKPADMRAARQYLRQLSGRTHQVYSSIFVADPIRERIRSELSHVTFRTLSDNDITAYFGKVNPLDKAGAYAAQGHGVEIIERIDGSYTNVVGLPMERTIELLREFGIVSAFRPVPVPQFEPRDGAPASAHGKGTRR